MSNHELIHCADKLVIQPFTWAWNLSQLPLGANSRQVPAHRSYRIETVHGIN